MESTRTISPEQFRGFVDDFSRIHAGQDVTVRVLNKELGPTNVASHRPLLGLSFNREDSKQLEVAIGQASGDYLRHVVGCPKAMRVAMDDNLVEVCLEIEPERGPTTLVMLPA